MSVKGTVNWKSYALCLVSPVPEMRRAPQQFKNGLRDADDALLGCFVILRLIRDMIYLCAKI